MRIFILVVAVWNLSAHAGEELSHKEAMTPVFSYDADKEGLERTESNFAVLQEINSAMNSNISNIKDLYRTLSRQKEVSSVTINEVNRRLRDDLEMINAGIASAAAISSLRKTNIKGKWVLSVGGAGYRGEDAIAVGVTTNQSGYHFKIAVSTSSHDWKNPVVTGCVSYSW